MEPQGTTIYSGAYQHTLDDKNRVTIPSQWRAMHAENDQFLATPMKDGSIVVLPPSSIRRIKAQLDQIPVSKREERNAVTRFFTTGQSFSFDKQGRVMITDAHRAHASISKDVVLAGAGDNFIIYSPAQWAEINKPQPGDEDILARLGI